MHFTAYIASPLGQIEISGTAETLYAVQFAEAKFRPATRKLPSEGEAPKPVADCIAQLEEYFAGKRLYFDLPLSPQGTDFQRKVWKLLLDIPYNRTISYLELAKKSGSDKNTRAVGLANGRNPIAIIIPCHRVIGSDGSLVGYGGDVWRKEWLLKHELENGPTPQGRLF
jgi:methylated-DNA-[protein]-cysteine S-methyltransferase